MTLNTSLTALLSAAALAVAAPVMAQDDKAEQKAQTEQSAPSSQEGQQATGIAAEDVTEAQIEAFVDAILAVEGVRDEFGPLILDAEDESAKAKLVEEANEEAFAAVDAVENMNVDTYVRIAQAAGENEKLNKRVMSRLTEMRQE